MSVFKRIHIIFFIVLLMLSTSLPCFAQQGVVTGVIANSINNEPVPFANVVVTGTSAGVSSDIDGMYRLENLEPGIINITASSVGFKPKTVYELQVTNNREVTLNIQLEENVEMLEGVEIKASPFNKTEESPVSLRTIGASEIQRNPGGNRDISKVIQSLPGVSTTVSFRNDIIIRGGAPNENRFYLDGIEVPNINHFATQGASGGPVGMINVDFLREVDFYSGAFPASRSNALSSVFDFKMKDGRKDRWGGNFTVGSSDVGLTMEGPVGENGTMLLSARRSYLQLLFKALSLPFLPTYNDFQIKYKTKVGDNGELNIIGLGAIDDFALNLEENETELDRFILGNLPVNEQWNYTIGAVFKQYHKKGFTSFIASRSMLDNGAFKYLNNDESSEDNLILDYSSREMQNDFRVEHTLRTNGYKFSGGLRYQRSRYENSTFNKIFTSAGAETIDFSSGININQYGAFAQVSKSVLEERVILSAGLRIDGNGFNPEMSNPVDQFSPRVSLSYNFLPNWSFNANLGRYFQLPAYTVMGYADGSGALINRDNGIKYIRADHAVAGFEFNTEFDTKFTIEGFYKRYANYPFLLRDSITLANLGGDFGVIGNEPAVSESEGRTYGFEFMAQQKMFKGFYGILAYTYVVSEFEDKNGDFISSAWDNRSIVSITAGKKFKKNWEIGLKFRYSGALPFTPFDVTSSVLIPAWNVNGTGILDYDKLNSERLPATHTLDLRIDKKWFFDKWTFNLFLDIQNAYNSKFLLQPFLLVETDDTGMPIEDLSNPGNYTPKFLENQSGVLQPTIGIVIGI